MKKNVLLCLLLVTSLLIEAPFMSASALTHTHTDDCYFRCQGVDYNKDGVINDCDLQITNEISTDGVTQIERHICRACGISVYVHVAGPNVNQTSINPHAVDKTKLICDATFTSITPTNSNQVVYLGKYIDTTATANFSNGVKGNIGCSVSGYNANSLSTQTVTLSFNYNGVLQSTKITVNVISPPHVHTDSCYARCQGIDYNKDGVIDNSDLENHTISGQNYGGNYMTCRACGATVYTCVGSPSGYNISYGQHNVDKSKIICPQLTIAPTVSVTNIKSDTVLSKSETNYPVSIKVHDNENDILTCNYYLDGNSSPTGTMTVTGTNPERVVTFPNGFNPSTLPEGAHTIRITVSDNYAPVGSTTMTFKVSSALNIFEYVYDSNGRLTAIKVAGITKVTYNYDNNGNLISVKSVN